MGPRDAWAKRVAGTRARGRRTVREAWFEALVDDQWMAAYRLLPGVHREPVIAEIRIFPRERTKGRPPGRWSAEVLGIDAKIPDGGISAEVVRRVRVGEHRDVGAAFWRWLQERLTAEPTSNESIKSALAGHTWRTFTADMQEPAATPKRGRPAIYSDEFYANLLKDYVQRVAQGSPRPTADVAKRRRLPAAKVRDLLHAARQRGLLSSSGQGRSGGQLTPKALAILNPGDVESVTR